MAAPTPDDIYDQIALAIGDTCIKWAILDSIVHDVALHLAAYLAAYLAPACGTDPTRHVLHITLSNMDPREKIATAKALAHEVDTADSPNFYEKAETLLNYLET